MPPVKDRAYWTTRIQKPDNNAINTGVTAAGAVLLERTFGSPRPDITTNCQDATNPRLLKHIVTIQVHDHFQMRGLRPFVELWKKILDRVKVVEPTLYDILGTNGVLCARYVRGSHHTLSDHSWGSAWDAIVGGITDTMGDGYCLRGLLRLYEIMKQVCAELGVPFLWWGAEWSREDSMHFGVSVKLLDYWKAHGEFA